MSPMGTTQAVIQHIQVVVIVVDQVIVRDRGKMSQKTVFFVIIKKNWFFN